MKNLNKEIYNDVHNFAYRTICREVEYDLRIDLDILCGFMYDCMYAIKSEINNKEKNEGIS
jgi:hypothetical protein